MHNRLWIFILTIYCSGYVHSFKQSDCQINQSITIGFVGDLLMHAPIQQTAFAAKDFSQLWRTWAPHFNDLDQLYANLELPLARGMDRLGQLHGDPGLLFDNNVHTSYPAFNSHPQLIEDLKRSNFTVLSTANNHALDRGPRGVQITIQELDNQNMPFSGTRTNQVAEWPIAIIRNKGFLFAWLSCTLILNSPDTHNLVSHCRRDWPQLSNLIQTLKRQNMTVIVTPHWGNENQISPSLEQKEFAQKFAEAGADAIIGAHPHVLQPFTNYHTSDGRDVFVAYSLGNFVANNPRVEQRSSIVLYLRWNPNSNNQLELSGLRLTPAFIQVRTGNPADNANIPWELSPPSPLSNQVKSIIDQRFPKKYQLSIREPIQQTWNCPHE